MQTISLNGYEYNIKPDDFVIKPHQEYNNLKIYPKVGELERIIGLLNDLTENKYDSTLLVIGWDNGGFIPINCAKQYKEVVVKTCENITSQIENIKINKSIESPYAVFVSNEKEADNTEYQESYILCNSKISINLKNFMQFKLHDTNLTLNVPSSKFNDFYKNFWYYFDEERNFKYDNLIHLCIMVKNAGPMFEKVLTENLPIIDRWTILDTGSTDGTQDIIRKVLKNKKGQLFEEPFINFRESRNRCLDLAGTVCKYNLMLDDTYVIREDLRNFLNIVRGDQFASSYSLLIVSSDSEYYSNRVTMPERKHRYIYTIHEVIQFEGNKENVVIPKNAAYIHDYRADYMEERTKNRKHYDLKLLNDMIEEDPTNPRHYYYMAQTYNCLEDSENAAKWFLKRATTELKGHDQEVFDSWFELGRLYNFKLNKPWEECKKCYEESMKVDPLRPEGLYFIGIHYYLESDRKTAYEYFVKAFALGYPIHAQFSLKPTLSYHFLPKFLAELCYEFKNPKLGIEACERFLTMNNSESENFNLMLSWYNIFKQLIKIPETVDEIIIPDKPWVVFVADGNWNPWTGRDILTKGMGGSETYIIEIARYVQASSKFNCIVFCKCSKQETFEGVQYLSLDLYPEFVVKNKIHTILISRFSEYIPMSLRDNVSNVLFILHDTSPSGIIIPLHRKLKNVLCLTNWHVELFLKTFSQFKDRAEAFSYGIDTALFRPNKKIKNSFIYSSFPNRGLLPLLQMWPKIKERIPDAVLNVYSDVNGKWVNNVAKDQMKEIHKILANKPNGVLIHGWVSKKDLAEAWNKSDIWLYPCIFEETFCLTALEAAATKTLAISCPLAALQETIDDRGILIEGNPLDKEWQDKTIDKLIEIINNPIKKGELIEKNYNWAQQTTWKARGELFIEKYLEEKDIVKNGKMFNWVNDVPINNNNRKSFEEALAIVNPKRILEIGTFAGTSIIEMLKLYPEAKGFAIDTWKNYDEDGIEILKNMEQNQIEKLFYENIKIANMSDRIKGIKGDSVDKLCELIEAGQQFDFIYVDGSHKCLDCYTDMILGWQLLRKGGILAVDDILYNINKVQQGDLLGYPFMAKKHFMEKYAGHYKIISDAARLFIQKI
jgi:predicted O-methyltransferase YrrM/glycosyltransferase involved in cell wall biosynthesis